MSAPKNQREVTFEEAIEQCRRNRRQAAILESRDGRPKVAKSAVQPTLQPVLTVRK